MRVRIHIERLVLDGIRVPQADRPRLQAAVETELARLIGEGGIGDGFGTGLMAPSLDADGIRIGAGSGPRDLGTRIAGALYGGLRR